MMATNSQTASDPVPSAISQLSGKSLADNAAIVVRVNTKPTMATATNNTKMPAAKVERGTVQRRKAASKRRAAPRSKPVTPVAAKTTKRSSGQAKTPKRIAPPSKRVDGQEAKPVKNVAKVEIIRERVTMPLDDYERIGALKKKCRARDYSQEKRIITRGSRYVTTVIGRRSETRHGCDRKNQGGSNGAQRQREESGQMKSNHVRVGHPFTAGIAVFTRIDWMSIRRRS